MKRFIDRFDIKGLYVSFFLSFSLHAELFLLLCYYMGRNSINGCAFLFCSDWSRSGGIALWLAPRNTGLLDPEPLESDQDA